jgi:hypothetical protein
MWKYGVLKPAGKPRRDAFGFTFRWHRSQAFVTGDPLRQYEGFHFR